MATIIQSYLEILPLLLCFICLLYYYCNLSRRYQKSSLPTNWPVVGVLPSLLQNCHRLHDYATEVLKESGGTFEFKGTWFANMNMVFTCDPANIHYILTKNFSNYPKGIDFRKLFDILGDGVFNADSELWKTHRKVTLSVLHHPNFKKLLESSLWEKVEKGLLPILQNCEKSGSQLDLQDIFQRFAFDTISRLLLDHDPGSLSLDLPNIPCEKAFNDAEEAIYYRHILPDCCWKLQKWLGIGKEKRLSKAWDVGDRFIYPRILLKQEHGRKTEQPFDVMTAFMEAYNIKSSIDGKLFMRDVMLSLMSAGKDTTSSVLTWLFWLLAMNPKVENKIFEEIAAELNFKQGRNGRLFNVEESHKLVYLHAALCETLRLFPPVAFQHKAPAKADVLPSGLRIDKNTRLILSFYSMGRMESIWGEHCLEFKPERWISEEGSVKHVPSFKFPAFNAGPRICLGKEIAFFQMKMVAACIIYNFRIHVVDGHPKSPSGSVLIQMKHGLMVRLFKRN